MWRERLPSRSSLMKMPQYLDGSWQRGLRARCTHLCIGVSGRASELAGLQARMLSARLSTPPPSPAIPHARPFCLQWNFFLFINMFLAVLLLAYYSIYEAKRARGSSSKPKWHETSSALDFCSALLGSAQFGSDQFTSVGCVPGKLQPASSPAPAPNGFLNDCSAGMQCCK